VRSDVLTVIAIKIAVRWTVMMRLPLWRQRQKRFLQSVSNSQQWHGIRIQKRVVFNSNFFFVTHNWFRYSVLLNLINMYTWNTGIILQNSVYWLTPCSCCWIIETQTQQGSFCASTLSKKEWQYTYFNKTQSDSISNSTLPLPEFLLNVISK
jgi:hypothetical protein